MRTARAPTTSRRAPTPDPQPTPPKESWTCGAESNRAPKRGGRGQPREQWRRACLLRQRRKLRRKCQSRPRPRPRLAPGRRKLLCRPSVQRQPCALLPSCHRRTGSMSYPPGGISAGLLGPPAPARLSRSSSCVSADGSSRFRPGRAQQPHVGHQTFLSSQPWLSRRPSSRKPPLRWTRPSQDKLAQAAMNRLQSVELNVLHTWLCPFNALSNGQRERANAAVNVRSCTAVDDFGATVDHRNKLVGAAGIGQLVRRHGLHSVVLTAVDAVAVPWSGADWCLFLPSVS